MTTVYKLTDQRGYTRKGQTNQLKWGEGISHHAKGMGGLCTAGCIHAYTTPELAVLLNPIHANISKPLMFEGEMDIIHRDISDLKVGGRFLTTTRRLKLPEVSVRQRVIFGLLCADAAIDMSIKHMPQKALEKLAEWRQWRDGYISGNTSPNAAYAAADAAARAARAAARASRAASAARTARAAYVAADAAYAAVDVARAAAYAAASAARAANAARAGKTSALDLAELARRAIELGR